MDFDVRCSLAKKPNGLLRCSFFWESETGSYPFVPSESMWLVRKKVLFEQVAKIRQLVSDTIHVVKYTMEIHGASRVWWQVWWHRVVFFPCEYDTPMVLLIAKILHHLGWCWNPINNGISTTNLNWWSPDFSHQQYVLVVSYGTCGSWDEIPIARKEPGVGKLNSPNLQWIAQKLQSRNSTI